MKHNMHEAKAKLTAMVEAALRGESVVIAKAGKPLVRLVPFTGSTEPRRIGRYKGQIVICDDLSEAK